MSYDEHILVVPKMVLSWEANALLYVIDLQLAYINSSIDCALHMAHEKPMHYCNWLTMGLYK